jgi:hypothetical protein
VRARKELGHVPHLRNIQVRLSNALSRAVFMMFTPNNKPAKTMTNFIPSTLTHSPAGAGLAVAGGRPAVAVWRMLQLARGRANGAAPGMAAAPPGATLCRNERQRNKYSMQYCDELARQLHAFDN